MDLQLKDKVILVTGGANGIGAAIVREAGQERAVPVIIDRDKEAGQALLADLKKRDSRCGLVTTDLATPESCASAVQAALVQFGRIDALVNCAGTNDRVGLEHGNPQQYLASLRANLLHYYNMAHYAVPELKRSTGCVVNIASKTAFTGQGSTSGYASAKGAILALTREWAAELLPYGIRVNAVVPAEVMTQMYQGWLNTFPDPEEKLETIVSKIPLGSRMTTPQEIAAMAVFLISPRAGHINAQQVFVDGGYVHLDRALT